MSPEPKFLLLSNPIVTANLGGSSEPQDLFDRQAKEFVRNPCV